jgi:hypothetical protein
MRRQAPAATVEASTAKGNAMAALSLVTASPAPHRAQHAAALPRPDVSSRDAQFLSIAAGYQRSGGLMGDRELLQRLRDLGEEQPISKLARWIVDGSIVHLEDEAQMWFPRCQFAQDAAWVRPAVTSVLAELEGVLERPELALWFATPSPWLDNEAPADLLGTRPLAVIEAARIDRFLLTG